MRGDGEAMRPTFTLKIEIARLTVKIKFSYIIQGKFEEPTVIY